LLAGFSLIDHASAEYSERGLLKLKLYLLTFFVSICSLCGVGIF